MRLLALQYDITWENKPANHAKVRALLERNPPTSPDTLVLLPEMFSTGFSMNVASISDSETKEDERFLSQLAQDFHTHILAGIVTTSPSPRHAAAQPPDPLHPPKPKGLNQALLLNPQGKELARYTKLHPYSVGKESAHYLPGPAPLVVPLAGFTLAPLICYDLRFPEAFRHATRLGATFHTVIASWPDARIHHWLALLQARAIENQSYVLGLNRTGRDPFLTYPGRSSLFDPKGNLLTQLGAEEAILDATIDPSIVSSWRAEFPFLPDMRQDLLGK